MENQKKQLFLEDGEGHRIPVSEKVYAAYWRYTNKEDYFMRQLKEERFHYDADRQIAEFVPSREDSYERLLEEGEEFACEQKPVEEQVIAAMCLEDLLQNSTEEEKRIAYLSFIAGMTDEKASAFLNLKRSTYQRRRENLFDKWRKEFDDTS